MIKKPKVVIIGAGIIGCATALELGKLGYQTLNIDKLPDAGFGSTSNSCAIVRAHYSTWEGVAMAYESFSYWHNWADYIGVDDERGYARFINCGTILFKARGSNYDKALEHYRSIGIEHEEWDLETLKQKVPMYVVDSFYPPKRPEDEAFWQDPTEQLDGALWSPLSGYVNDPQLATHNLMRAAQAQGCRFRFNAAVIEICRANGRVQGVTLKSGEEIDAQIVVNVAGPHSFVINRMAGVEDGMNIKTKALRHEVHHVPAPKGMDFEDVGCHTTDVDLGAYWRPEVGNTILIGSEDPECDPKEWVEDPDNFNRELSDAQWKAQVFRLARRMPMLEIPNQKRGLVDLYDVTDDWIPIYDKSDLGGFYMAVGTSGNQFKNGPVAGHVMALLIDACESGHDHDKEPLHVKLRHTGLDLNLGFFSRLREINPDSSFSVSG